MTTQEIADKLVDYCRTEKYHEAYDLYAEDAVSIEMPGMGENQITKGKKNILKGFEEWQASIKEVHGGSVGDPVVMGNHFCVPMSSDCTFEPMGRMKMEELCMYEVKDGKIQRAQYFYEMPDMPQ